MILSLCTGYGGLDLALEQRTGCKTEYVSDVDKHANVILAARFPNAVNLGDLKTIDWGSLPRPEWMTAGYPCQPFSHAGQRKGTDDPRHIFPYIAEGIRHLRPGNVLLENVRGHLTSGFDVVLGALADMGYDVSWGCLRASDAGAPHRRERVFIVATDANVDGLGWLAELDGGQARGLDGEHRGHADGRRDGTRWGPYASAIRRWESVLGRPAPDPTEPGRNGRPRLSPVFVEWMMGLPEGWVTDIDIPRNAQLKALGNGVVPQQALLALSLLSHVPGVAA